MISARRTPRQQRSRETVAVILEAAAQVFSRDGYPAATTNHVADRAGVSIGSLYHYFPDKAALLVALAEQELDHATAVAEQILTRLHRTGVPLRELVGELVTALVAAHTDRPALHQLLYEQAPRRPELAARFGAAQRRLAGGLAGHLTRLGHPAPGAEVTALLAVQGITAQLHQAVVDPPPGATPAQCLDQLVALWTRALAPPAG